MNEEPTAIYDIERHVGWAVLVTCGGNDAPRDTCIRQISPNRRFVLLASERPLGEWIGWVPIDSVTILDVFAPNDGRKGGA